MSKLLSTVIFSTLLSTTAFAEEAVPSAAGVPDAARIAAINAELSKDVHTIKEVPPQITERTDNQNSFIRRPNSKGKEMIKEKQLNEEEKKAENDPNNVPISSSAIGAVPPPPEDTTSKPDDSPLIVTPKIGLPVIPVPRVEKAPDGPSQAPNPAMSPALRSLKPGDDNAPVAAELSDGTQALFKSDGSVSIITQDGRYHTPPDGVLTLRDGTTFNVEGGMRNDK
jgi:hypothetical protein